MPYYEVLPIGILDLASKTVTQIEAIADPHNGMVALCNNDSTSEVCLVTYDETNSEWRVDETGSTMA